MNVLIVYAHPNPASFSFGLKELAEKELAKKGYSVKTKDLYANGFDPILSGADLQGIYTGNIPADIKAEQEAINEADLLVFVYPIWWTGLPAMVKGYIDRVFSYGFAYKVGATGIEQLLTSKKALLLTPHGTPKEYYEPSGMLKSLVQTEDGGIFNFCGIEVLKHFFFAMMGKEQADREAYLAEVSQYIKNM